MRHNASQAGDANTSHAKDNWRTDPVDAGGGYFIDLASHMINFLEYALGPITAVAGFAGNQAKQYMAEDIVSGSFKFATGVQGTGTWCFTAFEKVDLTEIIGSHGKISYANFDETPIVLTTPASTEPFAIKNPPHIQQPLIQTIVDELLGVGEAACPSHGESAAQTSWVMGEMLGQYYQTPRQC